MSKTTYAVLRALLFVFLIAGATAVAGCGENPTGCDYEECAE